jgi:hypothetical protein
MIHRFLLCMPFLVAASLLGLMDRVFQQSSLAANEGPAAPPWKPRIEVLSNVGSNVTSVAVSGNYAYIGVGIRLVILDITTPTSPQYVGQTGNLSGSVLDIVIDGTYAYLACDEGGMDIVDISNPVNPFLVGNYTPEGYAFERPIRGVAVSGDQAYVAADTKGLRIVDIADRAHPSEINYVDPFPGIALKVSVSGENAYVAGFDPLWVITITTPSAPVLAFQYVTPGYAYGVAVSGNYAYVADSSKGLSVVDVSNPLSPTLAGTFTKFYSTKLDNAEDIFLSGNRAYIVDREYGVWILDVTTPASPAYLGIINSFYIQDVAVSGNYAYLAENTGLGIVNIAAPATPTRVGSYSVLTDGRGVVISEPYAYVADWSAGLCIVDVSDILSPKSTGCLYIPGTPKDIALTNGYAYLASGGGGLQIVDVNDPLNPSIAASLAGTSGGVAISGDYAFVSDSGSYILGIADISDPTSPSWVPLGFASSCSAWPSKLVAAGDYTYMADSVCGVSVFNVSNKTAPLRSGTTSDPFGYVTDVALIGDYVFATDWYSQSLHVVNIANPASPYLVASYDQLVGGGRAIKLGANPWFGVDKLYAYVFDDWGWVSLLDVTDPLHPSLVTRTEVPIASGKGIDVVGNYVYVSYYSSSSSGSGGLAILRQLQDIVTGTIQTTGGGLISTGGDTTITFPSGAFTDTAFITYRHLWTDQDSGSLQGIGHTIDISAVYTPSGEIAHLAAGKSFSVAINYATSGAAIESSLKLFGWDEESHRWSEAGISSSVDTNANTVNASVDHLSLFAVLGDTYRVYLPVVMKNW